MFHYPYRFVKKVTEPSMDGQHFLLHKLLYSFKSPKSHQTYWVWVEVYQLHYILVNRKEQESHPELLEKIVSAFRALYPYFE